MTGIKWTRGDPPGDDASCSPRARCHAEARTWLPLVLELFLLRVAAHGVRCTQCTSRHASSFQAHVHVRSSGMYVGPCVGPMIENNRQLVLRSQPPPGRTWEGASRENWARRRRETEMEGEVTKTKNDEKRKKRKKTATQEDAGKHPHPQIPTAHGDFQNTNRPKEMGWLHLSQFETTHAARFGPPSSILIES